MGLLIYDAIENVSAAVKGMGPAREEDDALPYTYARPVSESAAAIEFSLDTGLIEASGILLVTHDDSRGRGVVYVVDFDPGSFRVVSGERVSLTACAFAADLAASLSQSPRVAHVWTDADRGATFSFELSL